MPQKRFSREDALRFAKVILSELSIEKLREAVQLWNDDAVHSLDVSRDVVLADVVELTDGLSARGRHRQHVQAHEVVIHPDLHPIGSECTCDDLQTCVHMGAVAVVIFSTVADPETLEEWLSVSNQIARPVSRVQGGRDFWGSGFLTGASAQKRVERKPKVVRPEPLGKSDDWLAYLRKETEYDWEKVQGYAVARHLSDVSGTLRSIGAQWREEERTLYTIFVVLHLYEMAIIYAQRNAGPTRDYYAQTAVRHVLQEIHEFSYTVEPSVAARMRPEGVANAAALLRTLVRSAHVLSPLSILPALDLWRQAFRYVLPIPREIAQIREKAHEERWDPLKAKHWIAYLLVLDGKDFDALQEIGTPHVDWAEVYAQMAVGASDSGHLDTIRTVPWLRLMSPLLNGRTIEPILSAAALWSHAAARYPEFAEEGESFLRKHLPYTRDYYDAYLFSTGRLRDAVEWHVRDGYIPHPTSDPFVKRVEGIDARAILPMLHQVVIANIELKNRDSYRVAVRYLVKLSRIYKKLKQDEQWNAYLTRLTERYARLRALHEEMRKRKLIS